jgi:hypothetical protein
MSRGARRRARWEKGLWISNIVRERRKDATRVTYLVDAGKDGERAAPESVVLRRWRRRPPTSGLAAFCGARLFPSFWRALALVAPPAEDRPSLDERSASGLLDLHAAELRSRGLKRPSPLAVAGVLRLLTPQQVNAMLGRHAGPAGIDPGAPGVADLFLFSVDRGGRWCAPRFVEVKRQGERLARHQDAELEAMAALDLRVQVFRLREGGG